MNVKVLGPGCAKCKTACRVVEKVIDENGVDATLTKVEDIMEIMSYNIISGGRGCENQGACAFRRRGEEGTWTLNEQE